MRLFFGSLHSSLFTFHFSLNASHDFSREKIRKKREENRKLCYAKRYSNTKNRFDVKIKSGYFKRADRLTYCAKADKIKTRLKKENEQ